jgi:hypothetical protein
MTQNRISLSGFGFERQGKQIRLLSPEGSIETDLEGFLRGVKHLLKMGFDLEGSAELDGGFIFRVEGERVQLKLGRYAEYFPTGDVETLFNRLITTWAAES